MELCSELEKILELVASVFSICMLQYSTGIWCSAGKFGGVFAAIPQPIVAAILCITFGMVGEYFLHLNRFQLKKNSEPQFKDTVFFHGQYSSLCS
jgi:amino acid permease